MSNPPGRPHGSKNQPGHAAGGSRPGAGHPKTKKCRIDSPTPKINAMAASKSASFAIPSSVSLFIYFVFLN